MSNRRGAFGYPMVRRTKIVCTIGPETASPDRLRALVDAGMGVARLNFSHGDHEEHAQRAATIRQVAHERDTEIMAQLGANEVEEIAAVDGPTDGDEATSAA